MKPFIEMLMDKVSNETRSKLTASEQEQLGRDVNLPHWIVLQSLLAQEVNGKLNQLATADLSDAKGVTEFAKIQGEVIGLRRFWALIEELLVVPEEITDAAD